MLKQEAKARWRFNQIPSRFGAKVTEMIQAPGSDRYHSGNVLAAVVGQSGDNAGPVRGGAVLTHLPLCIDAGDRHPKSNDTAQLTANEVSGCVGDGPWCSARAFVPIGEAGDDVK